MKNKPKLLYFHGLNSSKESRKFQDIKEFFGSDYDVSCIEWKNDDNIQKLLEDVEAEINHEIKPVLIGDSTGGNFAYQLKERRKEKGKKSILVLLNPLLSFDHRIGTHSFPAALRPYLKTILQPQDAFILLGRNDEVLDHSFLKNVNLLNTTLQWVDDSHRLPKFKEYLEKLPVN